VPPTEDQHRKYREQFRSYSHQQFQSWFETLALALHGPGDFLPIHNTHGDGGLDGLVISAGKVYQIYAPARMDELKDGKVAAKIKKDFANAHSTLGGNLRAWSFLHNHPNGTIGQLTAGAIAELRASHRAITFEILGIDSLWDLLVRSLSSESLNALFAREPAVVDRYVQESHTQEASRVLARILRRRGMIPEETRVEIALLAGRVADGDLQYATSTVHAQILYWAARLHASATTIEQARAFHQRLLRYAPPSGMAILEALFLESGGDSEGALRTLRDIENPDARWCMLAIRHRSGGRDGALAWFDARPDRERPDLLAGIGWRHLAISLAEAGRWQDATACLARVRHLWEECPDLPIIEGRLSVAFLLAPELRQHVFGPVIYFQGLRTLEGVEPDRHRAAASDCFDHAQELWHDLHPPQAMEARNWSLWLRLTHPDPMISAAAQVEIVRSMSDGESILRVLPLARARNIPFDTDLASQYLAQRSQLGGLDDDERRAEFVLNQLRLAPGDFLGYLDREADRLRPLMPADLLTAARIEALAADGQATRAKALLQEAGGAFDEDDTRRIEVRIAQAEGEDPRQRLEDLYYRTRELLDLTNLIGHLFQVSDWPALRPLLAELVRREPTRANAQNLVACMVRAGQAAPGEVLQFLEANPDLVARAPELQSAKAWSLFGAGHLAEADLLNAQLLAQRRDDADLDLDINIALAAGQWERFPGIVEREWPQRDQHTPGTLMRLAAIAAQVEVTAARAWDLAKLAVQRNDGDPLLLMSALWLRYRLGHDDDHDTASWLQEAVALSSEDGPLRVADLATLVRDLLPAQRDHQRAVEEAWLRGEIPLHIAASQLNIPLSQLLISAPRINSGSQDGRSQTLLPIISEHRQPQSIQPEWTVGLDIATLFVLAHLGLLEKVLDSLSGACLAPETLLLILNEHNQVRHHQPARVKAAETLREMLDQHKLRDAESPEGDLQDLAAEVGHDLAQLLVAARASGGMVVRPLPIYRPRSFMQEPAVLGDDELLICSTVDFELALFQRGDVDEASHHRAHRYLLTQDRPGNKATDSSLLNRPLYLDDLAVTYLQHAGLLQAMVAAGLDLRVHPSLREDTVRRIEGARHGEQLAATIDQVRGTLRAGIETGKIKILPRRHSLGAWQLPGAAPPTIVQFLDDTGACDAVCIDDRFVNRNLLLTDSQGRTVPVLCVLDLLRFLVTRGALTASEHASTLHQLRHSGSIFLPVTPEDLGKLAATARWSEPGDLLESAELRVLRQSLARIRSIPPLHESARLLLARRLFEASIVAIRQLWQDEQLPAERALRLTAWVWLHVAPSPHDWLNDDQATAEQADAALAWHVCPLLQPMGLMDERRHAIYLGWVENQVVGPLVIGHPGVVHHLGLLAGQAIEHWTSEPRENTVLFAHHLFDCQPPTIRDWLAANFHFRPDLDLTFERSLVLGGIAPFRPSSLFSAIRRLLATREPQTLATADGKPAVLRLLEEIPTLELSGGAGTPATAVLQLLEVGIFSENLETRLGALDQVLLRLALAPPPEAAALRQSAAQRPLFDDEIHQLLGALENAIVPHENQLRREFAGGRWLPLAVAPAYFESFYGPDPSTMEPETYITGPLRDHRRELLRRDLVQGLRICLRGALRDDLYPGEWLGPHSDDEVWHALQACHPETGPISLLASLDVALHRQHDPRFAAFADQAVAALLEGTYPLPCGHDFYTVFSALVELEFEKITSLVGCTYAPFWRRMCAWMDASLAAPLLPAGLDLSALQRSAHNRYRLRGQWVKLVDLRREPLAHPAPLATTFVRAEILDRLLRLAQSHQGAGRQVPRSADIDARFDSAPLVLTPQPLAAHLSVEVELPAGLAAQLAGVPIGSLGGAILPYAQLFCLPEDLRARLANSVAANAGEEARAHWLRLERVALIAAAQRAPLLADAVASAVLAMAPNLDNAGEIAAALVDILIAAAAWEDEKVWASWLRERLSALAYRVPTGEASKVYWHCLHRLADLTPLHLGLTHIAIATASAGMT
jgi:hypothetical protein